MCPCKDCSERILGCHANCSNYITWKEGRIVDNSNDEILGYLKAKKSHAIKKNHSNGKRKC